MVTYSNQSEPGKSVRKVLSSYTIKISVILPGTP